MRVAVSNIAWPDGADEAAAEVMLGRGVAGVELAPAKAVRNPLNAAAGSLRDHRRFWEARGIQVVALQAILHGRPELSVFGDDATRAALLAHLTGMMRVARELGAPVLVLGAPGSRKRGGLGPEAADALAVPLLRRAAEAARAHGVRLCIEPNPADYGCEYVTTSAEGRDLVAKVRDPGFGLHLDTAAMTLAGESLAAAIASAMPDLRHFHASEPFLAPVGTGDVAHAAAAGALERARYPGWVSVEMRPAPLDPLAALDAALDFATRTYGRVP